MRLALVPLSMLALLAACEATPPGAVSNVPARGASEPAPPPANVAKPSAPAQKLGAPITVSDAVALADIAAQPAKYAEKTVRTEGTVKAVCQSAGCWMELADGAGRAHIKMAGHKFFVPKNASGRHAVVQAVVRGTPDDGECEEEAEQATGRPVKLELEATGVELM